MNNATSAVSIIDELASDDSSEQFELWEAAPISTNLDILVLSCCLYRLTKSSLHSKKLTNNPFVYLSITDNRLYDHVNDFDIAMANKIRDFYNKKFMMFALKGTPLTKYRQDLLNFLTSDFKKEDRSGFAIPNLYIGLVHRLPQMYEYDLKLENMFGSTLQKLKGESKFNGSKKLSFVDILYNQHNSYKFFEYWFKDENSDMVMVPVGADNPLSNLFEHIAKSDYINISGRYIRKNKDGVEYLVPSKWQVVLS